MNPLHFCGCGINYLPVKTPRVSLYLKNPFHINCRKYPMKCVGYALHHCLTDEETDLDQMTCHAYYSKLVTKVNLGLRGPDA